MRRLLISVSAIALMLPLGARAQEVVTYVYDDLGRLIVTRVSGGARDGQTTGTSFDPAGNRTNHSVSGVGVVSPPPPPTPVPTPSPPPAPPPLPPTTTASAAAAAEQSAGDGCRQPERCQVRLGYG